MHPTFENLETRSYASVDLSGGNLIIRNEQSAIIYADTESVLSVDISGVIHNYDLSSVNRIFYFGSRGGNNYLEIDVNTIPSFDFLYGDNNTFNGSLGDDTVFVFGTGNSITGADTIH